MHLTAPTLAFFIFRVLLFTCILQACVCAQVDQADGSPPRHQNVTQEEVSCRPVGDCEACPHELLHEPFCQPFGNRRRMHCVNITATALFPSIPVHIGAPLPPHSALTQPHSNDNRQLDETTAWESCGRIVDQERADFWEFIACNVLFAGISLFVLFARSRRLQALQARQLAARIGLIRNTTRVRP